jgi:phage terminase large subunit-like protein
VPYDQWARQGLIETTPGAVTDWRFVTARIKQLATIFDIRAIGFDRYGARDTVADLADAGIEVVDFAQGPLSFNAPMRRIENCVKARTLVHTGHPILRWNIDCCSATPDANENLKPVKPDRMKGSKRIDGVLAMIMAVGMAMQAEPGSGFADLTCAVIG